MRPRLVWGHNSEGWMCSSSKKKIYLFALLLAAVYESSSHFHLPYLGFFFSLIKSRSMSCEGFFFTFFPLSLWLSFSIWHTASNAHANKDVRDERSTCPSKELSSLARMPLTERDPKAEKRRKKKLPNLVSSSQAPCSGRFEFCDDKLLARICTNGKIWMEKCYNSLAHSSLSENFFSSSSFLEQRRKARRWMWRARHEQAGSAERKSGVNIWKRREKYKMYVVWMYIFPSAHSLSSGSVFLRRSFPSAAFCTRREEKSWLKKKLYMYTSRRREERRRGYVDFNDTNVRMWNRWNTCGNTKKYMYTRFISSTSARELSCMNVGENDSIEFSCEQLQ